MPWPVGLVHASQLHVPIQPYTDKQGTSLVLSHDGCAATICSYDESNHKRYPPGLNDKTASTLIQAGGRFFYATAARLLALKFILSMSVSSCSSFHSQQQAAAVVSQEPCN